MPILRIHIVILQNICSKRVCVLPCLLKVCPPQRFKFPPIKTMWWQDLSLLEDTHSPAWLFSYGRLLPDTHVRVRLCVYLRLITEAFASSGRSQCAYVRESLNVCVPLPGAGFIESCWSSDKHTSIDKILQRRTRCHGRWRENNQPSSEVERRKARRRGEHTEQHERKINGRCLRRFSVALAKTENGFMRRRRRNSTFLGKD